MQKYWNIDFSLGKIQVRRHAEAISTNARWSAIQYDIDSNVDFLIIIIFSEDFKINEFYEIP